MVEFYFQTSSFASQSLMLRVLNFIIQDKNITKVYGTIIKHPFHWREVRLSNINDYMTGVQLPCSNFLFVQFSQFYSHET